jgi:hypothetical protein
MGTTSCVGGDPGATACMKMNFFGVLGKGGGGGQGRGRAVNAKTDFGFSRKAPFGALVWVVPFSKSGAV